MQTVLALSQVEVLSRRSGPVAILPTTPFEHGGSGQNEREERIGRNRRPTETG